MKVGFDAICLEHDTGDRHPEHPDRLRAARRGLEERHGAQFVTADPAAVADLERVHDPDYVADFRSFCNDGGGRWDADTVAVEKTWPAALASAGLARWAAETALDGVAGRDTPFALGRPPGHHAVTDDAMGFCFVNNVAVAAAWARAKAGADTVAILDWDVHHGNGTQDIFYDDGDVFYASIHEEGLYPGTGGVDETGTGEGDGTTLNVPLTAGAGDAEYLAVAESVVEPAIRDAAPDLLLVSAGFDAHRYDPISRMTVTEEGFALLTDWIRDLANECDAGLGFVLEGGYGMESLAAGVGIVHETLGGRRPTRPAADPNAATRDRIGAVRAAHGMGSK